MAVAAKDHQLVFVDQAGVAITGSRLLSTNVFALLLYVAFHVRGFLPTEGTGARRGDNIGVKSSALLHHGVVGLKTRGIVILNHVGVLEFKRSRGLQLDWALGHILLQVLGDH